MKNIRILYKKQGALKFISHLDMNRLMLRLLRRASLPIWYTEGFHPHPYMTFALPLSLGFESSYDILDIRVTDDNFAVSNAAKMLAEIAPDGLEFIESFEPINKIGSVSGADFKIEFWPKDSDFQRILSDFMQKDNITAEKRKKNGSYDTVNLSQKLQRYSVETKNERVILSLRLPAGSQDNLNPLLFVSAFIKANPKYEDVFYSVGRVSILDQEGKLFR